MEIDVDETPRDVAVFHDACPLEELQNCLLCCVDCGVHSRIWVLIEPVQVLVERVLPIVTSKYTIRIEAWHYFEYKVLSQKFGLLIISITIIQLRTYSLRRKLIRPFKTNDDGISPG
jgi:hypothetical protein